MTQIPARTLLLTATINPPEGVPFLARTDPAVRLGDYARALEYYLTVPDELVSAIVLVENSGRIPVELRSLEARARKRLEFVCFSGLDYPPEYGRGYGEFKALDYAMSHSAVISALPGDAVIWKGTGRYRLLNIARVFPSAPVGCDLYCDLRDWPKPWMDLRLFAVTVSGYKRIFEGIYQHLREDLHNSAPETVMRRLMADLLGNLRVVPRFSCEPYVDGVRGADNKNFVEGELLLQSLVRDVLRRLAPSFWW